MATRLIRSKLPVRPANSTASRLLARRTSLQSIAKSEPVPEEPRQQIVAHPGFELGPLADILSQARATTRRARGDSLLHVSDLLYKCQRRVAIIARHELADRGSSLSLSQELTFAQGDAIHDVLKRRSVLGDASRIWGRWRCRCQTLRVETPCLHSEIPTDVCEVCGEVPMHYDEVPMFSEPLALVGTPDLILWYPEVQAFCPIELKSITHETWKDMARPDPDHVLQLLFYWYLMRENGYPLVDKVSILYATKSMLFKGPPYKEFVFAPQEQLHRLDPYIEEALELKRAIAGGKLPVRRCANIGCSEAKACEVSAVCFAMP